MSGRILGYRFLVRPKQEDRFPLDMLRYDSCFPADQAAVAVISNFLFYFPARDGLREAEMFSPVKPPSIDRWLSFGWECDHIEVVDFSDAIIDLIEQRFDRAYDDWSSGRLPSPTAHDLVEYALEVAGDGFWKPSFVRDRITARLYTAMCDGRATGTREQAKYVWRWIK